MADTVEGFGLMSFASHGASVLCLFALPAGRGRAS
jgi:hypothetical protein